MEDEEDEAYRWRRAGAGCGSAALIPPRAGNGGNDDTLARRSVGSVCTLKSNYNVHPSASYEQGERKGEGEGEGRVKADVHVRHKSFIIAWPYRRRPDLRPRRIIVFSGQSAAAVGLRWTEESCRNIP